MQCPFETISPHQTNADKGFKRFTSYCLLHNVNCDRKIDQYEKRKRWKEAKMFPNKHNLYENHVIAQIS